MNPETAMTLREAVDDVLSGLTGLELQYIPEYDRFRNVTRQLNKALRLNALEREWSYYTSTEDLGPARMDQRELVIRSSIRPRIIGGDAIRFTDDNGEARAWAFFLPRDVIDQYPQRQGLWASITRQTIRFSKPIPYWMEGLHILLPVMREPKMFHLPERDGTDTPTVPQEVLQQLVDFDFPDLIVARASYLYSLTDPVMQPRAQQLQEDYTQIFYALNERDDRNTDLPYQNEWLLPIQSSINGSTAYDSPRPFADERH